MQKTLVIIAGATAVGKTAACIQLARTFQSEIISCDSRQFYKELAIGTAVPSKEELAAVPHHFIQNRSITENYSVGMFERDCLDLLPKLFKKHDIVFMTGGSGLYIDAVCNGLDMFPDIDPSIRKELNEQFEKEGITPLQEQLQVLDPVYYAEVDKANPHRLIRALEVCIGSGKAYSSFKNRKKAQRDFRIVKLVLQRDREVLYDRINQRVDLMIENGLEAEVASVSAYRNHNALLTVGYKEIFMLMDGQYDREKAIDEIKKNTRRFAKRQMTWFRRDPAYQYFAPHEIEEMIHYIKTQL